MTRQEAVEALALGMCGRNCDQPRERRTPDGPALVVQQCPGIYTHRSDARLILAAVCGPWVPETVGAT